MMMMKTSHLVELVAKYHAGSVDEKKVALAKVYVSGGVEALEAAARIVKISPHHARCLAGVEAFNVKKNRRGRKNWGRDLELAEEISALAHSAAGGGRVVSTGGKVVSTTMEIGRGRARRTDIAQAYADLRTKR
ncbi:MAG: hypothetical protein AB1815_05810 [Bacillota bacterium]